MYCRIQGSLKYFQEEFCGKNREVVKQLKLIKLTLLGWHGWRSREQINLGLGPKMGCSISSLDFVTRLVWLSLCSWTEWFNYGHLSGVLWDVLLHYNLSLASLALSLFPVQCIWWLSMSVWILKHIVWNMDTCF